MLEVFLQDPGIVFVMASGRVVRTPVKFIIDEKERELYESLIRVSPIQNFTINETDKKKPEKIIKKKVSNIRKKPKQNIGISVNLQG